MEEEIWALEEAYFANLYQANYGGVLALVHSRFLGWPGAVPQPIDREESARFMKQLVPQPASCSFKIERAGIRLMGEVALTQYTLQVKCRHRRCDENTIIPDNPYLDERRYRLEIAGGHELR